MIYHVYDNKAECDRCGRTTLLSRLTAQVIAGHTSGLKVCPLCLDEDHPQQFVNRYSRPEKLSVDGARPPAAHNTGPAGFDPVPSFTLMLSIGKVWAV